MVPWLSSWLAVAFKLILGIRFIPVTEGVRMVAVGEKSL
jgi:hypothetical protein